MCVVANYCHIHCYVRFTNAIMILNKPQIHTISHTAEPKWYITIVGLATYTDRAAERIRRTQGKYKSGAHNIDCARGV